jgi:hypothetical protein
LDGLGREPRARIDPGSLSPAGARVVRLVQGAHLWSFLGDARRHAAARGAAIRESRALGADAGRALSAPISHRWVRGRVPQRSSDGRTIELPARRAGGQEASSRAPVRVVRVDAHAKRAGEDDPPLVVGSRRVATDKADWWPAYQTAYLDLGYRWLPKRIERRLGTDAAPALRFWVVGYEDGSQVFLLAALIEDAIDRVRRVLEERAGHIAQGGVVQALRRLEALRIEIVATDLGLTLDRDGRVFHLAGFGPGTGRDASSAAVPSQEVANLTVSELGPAAAREARAEVERLERGILRGQVTAEKLDALADAGKTGILFERFFRPGIEIRYAGSSPRFEYHLHNDRWRIEDGAGVLNEGARWSMTFSQADVTRAEPPAEIDGVVVTNVLPWLELYAEALDGRRAKHPVRRAWSRIGRSVRSGGWILIDPLSERVLDPAWAAPVREREEVLVTTAVGVERASARFMRGESISSSEQQTQTTLLSTSCVNAADRSDILTARKECDEAAARAGSSLGFIRPCHPSDGERRDGLSCAACSDGTEALWLCFGIPQGERAPASD